jgi:ATP-binding protein involved in chromosome partitioning
MPAPSRSDVLAALEPLADPETGRSVVRMEQVGDVVASETNLDVKLGLTSYSAPLWNATRDEAAALLKRKFPSIVNIAVNIVEHVRRPERIGQIGLSTKSVIAVASGKGGVGKSTVAVSVALGLKRAGCKVGLMDADVYGPSIPHLVGVSERPEVNPETKQIIPADVGGLKMMSMGLLVPPGEAVVWRGPMLHGAITQFLRDTAWGDLDYLIIDMPPGTGDIALTLSQLLPLTGAVVVCTPQDVALLDAVKAIAMFRKVNIPILGMVENMSYFLCPDNGKRYDIFGHGGAKKKAEELAVPFLGEVPINVKIRINGDEGHAERTFDDSDTAPHFEAICLGLVKGIADERRKKPPTPSLPVL